MATGNFPRECQVGSQLDKAVQHHELGLHDADFDTFVVAAVYCDMYANCQGWACAAFHRDLAGRMGLLPRYGTLTHHQLLTLSNSV